MNRSHTGPRLVLPLLGGLALLSFLACGTKDVAPDQMLIDGFQTSDDQGAFLIAFASTDPDYDTNQARLRTDPPATAYRVLVDGKQLVLANGGQPWPIATLEGGEQSVGFLSPGTHHVEIAEAGHAPLFAGDAQFPTKALTRLYLFGALDAIQGRFVSAPLVPADGTEHVSAINLIRGGASIEVVSCTDASTCTALSPPLAMGDTYAADFPALADPSADSASGVYSLSDAGVGIGYREVATAARPAPPVLPLLRAIWFQTHDPANAQPPANFVAAPIFISADGTSLASFE